jgi:RNA polymerase sigma factor (sigma-70 family)
MIEPTQMKEVSNITDQELVEHCIQHKRPYQEVLYRRFADEMYSVALIYCNNDQDACDVVQESFIKVFRKIHTFKNECPLKAWIRRIIVNTALDHYRKRKREQENSDNYTQLVDIEVNDIIPQINATELLQMINQLPQKAAMVLKLYAIEGYGHKEIAERMSISEGTSKSQLNRARGLLKNLIAKLNG